MYLLTRDYKAHSEYNFLLLLSLLLTITFFFIVIQNSEYITISPEKSKLIHIEENVVSITINPAPIIKKEIKQVIKPKPIKEIVKKKIVKKKVQKAKAVEPVKISEPEPIKHIEPEVIQTVQTQPMPKTQKIIKQITKEKPIPIASIFDAQMKDSFIAGLYELLDEKKYYPKMAKRRKLEGISQISFTLSKDGLIKEVFLQKSCGHKMLDSAALKVVRSIEFYKPIPDAVSMASLHLNIPIKYSRN